jgi:hypothetical protein
VSRELNDAAVREQAACLAEYVRRGGSASRWLDSKDFSPADRVAVLVALGDAEEARG